MGFRLAIRTLLRFPLYSATAIGTIVLTIALGSTVFAVVDGVLFKPLPYPSPERLFGLMGSAGSGRSGAASLAALDVDYLRAADPRISIAAIGGGFPFQHPDRPDIRIWSVGIDASFFDVLGQHPLVGGFRPEDYAVAPGASTPAIVSYGFWRRWLGSDPGAVGRTLHMVGRDLVIAGILPRDFLIPVSNLMGQVEILVPLGLPPNAGGDRWARYLNAVARLGNDITSEEAKARLDGALAARAGEYPPRQMMPGPYVAVFMQSVEASLVSSQRSLFRAAFAGSALLVVLGAISVAGLVGARGRDRALELSLRSALGARRRDLIAILMTEAWVIAVAGGAIGIALARPLLTAVTAMLPETLLLLKTPAIDWRVVMFAAFAAIGPVVFFALVPIGAATRDARAPRLTGVSTSTPRVRSWGRSVLLAAESAIGIVLVIAGSLLVASFVTLRTQDPGLGTDDLALLELQFTRPTTPAERAVSEASATERLRRVPGIRDVATIRIPVLEGLYGGSQFSSPPGAARIMASDVPVSAAFFDVAGLRIVDGRVPTREEMDRTRPVAVVSEAVARAYWPNARAVGQVLQSAKTVVTVVGVVGDARLGALNDRNTQGEIYLPWGMGRAAWTVYLLKTTGDPDDTVRRAALALRSDVPGVLARRAESMDGALAKSVRLQQFQTMLFTLAGGAGLVLLAVGVGGLVAMGVARRVREIGIRSALGARQRQVVRMIVLEHLRPSLAGVVFGLIGSWWATRLIRAFLYEIDAHEPVVWVAATATLLAVATIAAWLPARRASAINPIIALRDE